MKRYICTETMPRKIQNQVVTDPTQLQQILKNAQQLFQAGENDKALNICRQYLKTHPDNIETLNLAGIIADRMRQHTVAEDFFRQAIKISPNNILLYSNLANSLLRAGNIDKTIATYQAALNLAPDNQDILLKLGKLYLKTNKGSAATRIFQRLIDINPKNIAALVALEQHYKNILINHPKNFPALRNLGNVLKLGRRYDEAKEYFLLASDIAPEDVNALSDLAHIYYYLDQPAEAEPVYRKAIGLSPGDPSLYIGLGLTLNNLGQRPEAIDAFRSAISIEPTCAQAHNLLSFSKTHHEHDTDIMAMEKTLAKPDLNTEQKYFLNFGLGKAYEDLQEYDKSFAYYSAANDLKRSTKDYDINNDEKLFREIEDTVNEELFSRFRECGFNSRRPIFIIGMPRSGSTLVEQILSRHPDIYAGGELRTLDLAVKGHMAHQLNSKYPMGIKLLGCQDFEHMGQQYCEMLAHYDTGAAHVTNKMPQNFLHAGIIRLMLPNATIIHCIRNPLDVCFSCYANSFRDGHDYTYNLEELGRYYCLYDSLMNHWRQIEGIKIFDFHYEQLISDQKTQSHRLLDACGLEWNDACLDFHKSDRPVMTASVNQVREGLYNKSIQRWKRFESHLTPLIDTLRNGLTDPTRLI